MLAVGLEVLERLIPTATIFKLDIQMFPVEPEHPDDGQEFFRLSPFMLSFLRTDRLSPTFTDAVTETQSAVVS